MATLYLYKWLINGRKLEILQQGSSTSYDPNTVTTNNMWLTPENSQTDGILIDYVYSGTQPTAESDTIDVDAPLALALVDYVRFRMAEDEGKEKIAHRFYGKFLARVGVEADNRLGLPRKIIPTGTAVLR